MKPDYDASNGMSAEKAWELLARTHTHLITQSGYWAGNGNPPTALQQADAIVVATMSIIRKEFGLTNPTPDVSDITNPKRNRTLVEA